MRISKGYYYRQNMRVMSTCKLKINVNLPHLFITLSLRLKMVNLNDLKGFVLTVTLAPLYGLGAGPAENELSTIVLLL